MSHEEAGQVFALMRVDRRSHFGMGRLLCMPSFDLRHEVLEYLADLQELTDEKDMAFRRQISVIHLL